MTAPYDVVQSQLDAYNAHDLERFLTYYAVDTVVRHGDGRVLLDGLEQIRGRYARLFADYPALQARVTTRLQVGE